MIPAALITNSVFSARGAELEGRIWMDVLASGRGLIEICFPLRFMIAVNGIQVSFGLTNHLPNPSCVFVKF